MPHATTTSVLPDSQKMKLYIKYMVSLRCKLMVRIILDQLHIPYRTVELGFVETNDSISPAQQMLLQQKLQELGLELLDDKKKTLIESIKNVIVEMIHDSGDLPLVNYSVYISDKLGFDYTYLANTFSEVQGVTIQHFIIHHKIERAKELLLYNELSLTEISYRLQYSSVAHLSNQFKKVTGLTPTFFKRMRKKRVGLEEV